MLLAPALALPLVVGSANTASADAIRRTNVNGTVRYPVHPGAGQLPTRARRVNGVSVHVLQTFSRTWV